MWRRPEGPPHVWKIVDIVDKNGETRKFTIEEIPEDRYDEVLEHLCKFFVRDEPMCISLGAIDEPESIELFNGIWKIMLNQGITVGAFEVNDNDEKSILAGINVLYYGNEELDKELESIERNTSAAQKVVDFALETCSQVDPRTIYNVDCYLGGFGLSVVPEYRGMGLGRELLSIRDDIGKTYNIEYTSTIFTGPFSQAAAASVGFDTDLERNYSEAVDENGQPLFPDIKVKSSKVMSKRIS